jgi:hypothetical protein
MWNCGTTLNILEKLEYDFNRVRDKSNDEECAATLDAFELYQQKKSQIQEKRMTFLYDQWKQSLKMKLSSYCLVFNYDTKDGFITAETTAIRGIVTGHTLQHDCHQIGI